MEQSKQIILSIFKRVLGEPKSEKENTTQFEFNCIKPKCRHDHDKFNLNFNSDKNIFHCWKCNYSGGVHKFAEDYGTEFEKQQVENLIPRDSYVKPEINLFDNIPTEEVICKLPFGFKPFSWSVQSIFRQQALDYLFSRGISKEVIQKYNLGYVEEGYFKDRIIIPSYNTNNNLNYFVGRVIDNSIKPNYQIPNVKKVPKNNIIFNENNVNFDLPVYLVEGVFDMFPLYNVVPMLGKIPSIALLRKLIKHKSKVIICLDEDAFSDSIDLYKQLESYGLDVYFVEIQDDIGKFFELFGKEKLMAHFQKNIRKMDFKYILELNMKAQKNHSKDMDDAFLREEYKKIEIAVKNN